MDAVKKTATRRRRGRGGAAAADGSATPHTSADDVIDVTLGTPMGGFQMDSTVRKLTDRLD
jgi:hypothetical protein